MEGNKPGQLSTLDLETEKREVIFRGGDADGVTPLWEMPPVPALRLELPGG
jgi:hypothetical protein